MQQVHLAGKCLWNQATFVLNKFTYNLVSDKLVCFSVYSSHCNFLHFPLDGVNIIGKSEGTSTHAVILCRYVDDSDSVRLQYMQLLLCRNNSSKVISWSW